MWRAVYTAVKQGKKISQPLQKSPLLPKAVVQMIGAGEDSGKLGEVPLMIVVMGGMVGFIAMSIILPIFKLSQLVK